MESNAGSTGSAKILSFKEYRDLRLIVESNIKAFVKHGTMEFRIAMMDAVTTVMRKYGRRKMTFGAYRVTLVTCEGKTFPVIQARRVLSGCPSCGREHGLLYIRTQKQNLLGPQDLVTWGCMECGEIFARWEPNERSEEGA